MHAHAQAILLLRKGLALNAMLPPSHERDGVELNLHTAMGTSLVATTFYGSAEVIAIYQRCQQLCDQLGQPPSPPVLRGLALVAIVQSRFDEAYRLGEHLVSTGTRNSDGTAQVEGHYVQGVALFWTGAIAASRLHLELALSQYAPDRIDRVQAPPSLGVLARPNMDARTLAARASSRSRPSGHSQ